MDLNGEMKNVIFVWTTVLASLFTCHKITSLTAPGITRLCAFIPFCCLFFYLPLFLTTVHFTNTTSFFITWLANFKLLLFAFDKGPLYSNPPLTLSKFILTACVPVKITNGSHKRKNKSIMSYFVKFMLFVLVLKLYEYGDYFHPMIKMALFGVHIYVVLDVGLAMVAYVARAIFGLHFEPQFDEPYLATSLQNFWGKRWNLMVTGILYPAVYLPVRSFSNKFLSRKLASLSAVMASFIVSGLMHELIFYYMGRLKPTWEITWFFVIHGVLVCLELVAKMAVGGRFRLPAVVSWALASSVVVATSFWLFFPPFLRGDTEVRSCKEFAAFRELVVRGRFVGPNDVSCPYI